MTPTAAQLAGEVAGLDGNAPTPGLSGALSPQGGFTLDGQQFFLPAMNAGERAITAAAAQRFAAAGTALPANADFAAHALDVGAAAEGALLFAPPPPPPLPPPPATPAQADHLTNQTPIKNQLDRQTCAAFATLAAMEAILLGRQAEAILSEQFAIRLAHGGNPCQDVTDTLPMVQTLAQRAVCPEQYDPYEDRYTVTLNGNCVSKPLPAPAAAQAIYLIANHQSIDNTGASGQSIANPSYLESLIDQGHDVVIEIEGAFDLGGKGILDVQIDPATNLPRQTGFKHDLLVVGYDRTGTPPYFICKNSFGVAAGHHGYFLFSYSYITTYAIRGVLVDDVRTIPAPPATP